MVDRFLLSLSRWRGWNAVWAVFIFLLPFTSMPFIVRLVHSDVVAAPSALILLILVFGWAVPRIILRTRIPDTIRPFIFFVLIAALCTLISFFYQIPYFKGKDVFSPSISAFLTLLIGFSFCLVSALWNSDSQKMKRTLQIINVSGAVVVLWTLMQAFFWYKDQRYPEWMREIQFTLSVGSLYRQRFVGFTLEPSWLAHQMNLLYLPWWFAASVTGYSAFSRKWKGLTVERFLFFFGALVLFLTLSRVGLVAFLLTIIFFALRLAHSGTERLILKIETNRESGSFSKKHRRFLSIFAFLFVLIVVAALGFFVLYLLTKLDYRMANLFNLNWRGRSDPIFYLSEQLSLAARFVYWDAGWQIFDWFPLFGVGLGHAGFYMPDALTAYAYRLVEVRELLYRSDILMNIKSIWIRILAETGIVGFTFFFLWILKTFWSAYRCTLNTALLRKTVGWMGCFSIIAFLLEGFSLDTFALPYFWFTMGMTASVEN